jgi:hypothetical protein
VKHRYSYQPVPNASSIVAVGTNKEEMRMDTGTAGSSTTTAAARAPSAPPAPPDPNPPPPPPSTPPPPANAPPLRPPEKSAASVPFADARKKRKKYKAAVTEDEDIAILKAVAQLRPHRAPWGHIKKRWQQVVDTVTAEVGEHREISIMLCQRRYETLLDRFISRRKFDMYWPSNNEMRALLKAALEERMEREDAAANRVASITAAKEKHMTLDAFQAAYRVAMREPTPKRGFVKEEYVDIDSESIEDGEVQDESSAKVTDKDHPREDDLHVAGSPSASPTGRRSFVESTLLAVLDRLAGIERTWAENDREEREMKRQQLAYEQVAHKRPEANTDGRGSFEATGAQDTKHLNTAASKTKAVEPAVESTTAGKQPVPRPAIETPSQDGATGNPEKALSSEFQELKKSVATLSTMLQDNTQQQFELNQQVTALAKSVNEVQQEKATLQQDVATLQAMLRDAASLAGTLRVLRDSHQQHEQSFRSYVLQQDTEIGALKRQIEARAPGFSGQHAVDAFQKEREELQADYRKRLAELDAKMALLDRPVTDLKATLDKQRDQLKQIEQKEEATQADGTETAQVIKELRTAIETERTERHSEYGRLVETIERVVAGRSEAP